MDPTQQNNINNNPLKKYFRQPAIYIKLLSNGEYWPEGSLELPVTGEIPVYPLTTRDEITLKTPDALMNGAGVVDAIHSCCPSIKNAWLMPNIDVDSVLIAIRIASYGHDMDFDVKCPHCEADNTFTQDLRDCLAQIKSPDYNQTVTVDDLIIKLKPVPYFSVNKTNQITFEEQKLYQALENVDLDPQLRNAEIQGCMKRLVEIGLDNLTIVTDYIATSDGDVVSDAAHLKEFYTNVSSQTVATINEKLAEIKKESSLPPLHATCTNCTKEFDIPIEFDYASFFGKGF